MGLFEIGDKVLALVDKDGVAMVVEGVPEGFRGLAKDEENTVGQW